VTAEKQRATALARNQGEKGVRLDGTVRNRSGYELRLESRVKTSIGHRKTKE